MNKCPDCEKAKKDPEWVIYRNGCRGCIKRQLDSMNKPKPGLSDARGWIGKAPAKDKKPTPKKPEQNTLELKILDELLKAWNEKQILLQDKWKFDLQDFERVDKEMMVLSDTKHDLFVPLVMEYKPKLARPMQDEGHEYQTQAYYEKLKEANERMLDKLSDVIQKHIWKSIGGRN